MFCQVCFIPLHRVFFAIGEPTRGSGSFPGAPTKTRVKLLRPARETLARQTRH